MKYSASTANITNTNSVADKNLFRKVKVINKLNLSRLDLSTDKSPHPVLRANDTIKWMRKRSPPKTIAKSLNKYFEKSLENKNNKSKEENNKRTKGTRVRSLDVDHEINHNYLFSQTEIQNITQLKDLFLEFDRDKSKTLELKEIQNMFKVNKIPLDPSSLIKLLSNKNELTDLKNLKKMNFNKVFLNFDEIVSCAISEEMEEKYRTIMRDFKRSRNIRSDSKATNHGPSESFIPMDFRLLLEYFNDKAKIRDNLRNVKVAMDKMEILTNYKKIQLTSKRKNYGIDMIEKENKFHKQIDFQKLCKNFDDVVNISQKNIDKITSKSKEKELRHRKLQSSPSADILPAITGNNCPANMSSFYKFCDKTIIK